MPVGNESNLPPGVTPEMIDAQCNERFKCATCDKDVTDDPAELVCKECGDPICDDCSDEHMKMCKHCHLRESE